MVSLPRGVVLGHTLQKRYEDVSLPRPDTSTVRTASTVILAYQHRCPFGRNTPPHHTKTRIHPQALRDVKAE